MKAAIEGSASLIHIDVLAFVCVLFVYMYVHTHIHRHTDTITAVFDLYTQWQSPGHIVRPFSTVCCTLVHCVVGAYVP